MRRLNRIGLCLVAALAAACSDGGNFPGEGGATFGPPIVVDQADYEKWVWISVPEMRCADDSEGGFAVNFTKQSRDLVVYLLGWRRLLRPGDLHGRSAAAARSRRRSAALPVRQGPGR